MGESRGQHWSILRANRRVAGRTILMGTQRNPGYWIKKKASRKTGYPIGTLAYYGPNNTFASKAVVGIAISENDDATELRKWFAETTDVRLNQAINEQIIQHLEQRNVQRVAMISSVAN